jgi:hypothetical protein
MCGNLTTEQISTQGNCLTFGLGEGFPDHSAREGSGWPEVTGCHWPFDKFRVHDTSTAAVVASL